MPEFPLFRYPRYKGLRLGIAKFKIRKLLYLASKKGSSGDDAAGSLRFDDSLEILCWKGCNLTGRFQVVYANPKLWQARTLPSRTSVHNHHPLSENGCKWVLSNIELNIGAAIRYSSKLLPNNVHFRFQCRLRKTFSSREHTSDCLS